MTTPDYESTRLRGAANNRSSKGFLWFFGFPGTFAKDDAVVLLLVAS